MRVLAVCATEFERSRLSLPESAETLICGVGPVEAAARTAAALCNEHFELVLNLGIGGGFEGRCAVGDACSIGSEFVEIDRENGEALQLPNGERLTTHAASDATLVELLAAVGFPPRIGVTVSRVTTTEATAKRLSHLGAEVESLEGFAVLRAAELAEVRALELRGISNLVAPKNAAPWNLDAAFEALNRISAALFCAIEAT